MISRINLKSTRLLQGFIYLLILTLGYIFFYLFTKLKIEGMENLPKRGRFILAANHQNFFDGCLLAMLIGPFRRTSFLISKRPLKTEFLKWLAKAIGSVPLGNGVEEYQRALKKLNNILTHGGIATIFPEGTVTSFSQPTKFKGGVAKLSMESRSLVVPVYFNGTYNLRHSEHLWKKPEITIKIGKPVDLYNYADICGNNLDKMAAVLREKVVELYEPRKIEVLEEITTNGKTLTDVVGVAK